MDGLVRNDADFPSNGDPGPPFREMSGWWRIFPGRFCGSERTE